MSTNAVDPLALFREAVKLDQEPTFYDDPFGEIDGRFLCHRNDWRDLLTDLDSIRRAPHKCAEPDEYPCYVTTAFLGGVWVHQTMGLSWLSYMQNLQMDRPEVVKSPVRFGQRLRRSYSRSR